MKAVKVINDNICIVESRQKVKEGKQKAKTGHWGCPQCEISYVPEAGYIGLSKSASLEQICFLFLIKSLLW